MKSSKYDIDIPISYRRKERHRSLWLLYPAYHDSPLVSMAIAQAVSDIGFLIYYFGSVPKRCADLLKLLIRKKDHVSSLYEHFRKEGHDRLMIERCITACTNLRDMFLQNEYGYHDLFSECGEADDKIKFMKIMKIILVDHIRSVCAELVEAAEKEVEAASEDMRTIVSPSLRT